MNHHKLMSYTRLACSLFLVFFLAGTLGAQSPNIVFVISDDQGYGTLAARAIQSSKRQTSISWPPRAPD